MSTYLKMFNEMFTKNHIEHFQALTASLRQRNICLDINLRNSLALMLP